MLIELHMRCATTSLPSFAEFIDNISLVFIDFPSVIILKLLTNLCLKLEYVEAFCLV